MYVDRISQRLINDTQRAISYVEMRDYQKALDAMRDIIADLHELTKAVSLIEDPASPRRWQQGR